MAEHHASVTVNAPVHQVYSLFTHFNDFPKFMSFIKEVTYYDEQRSHWVAEVVGRHEWDAVNDNWVEDQQIGWRSTSGLENSGRVTFQPTNATQTLVDVSIEYDPPAGILGDAGEVLGGGKRFENALQNDLNNFARMVDQAPAGALDPESSNYLFHSGSAAAKGTTTTSQDATMGDSPMNRDTTINQEATGYPGAAIPPQTGVSGPTVLPPDRETPY
jgi:ribosome-associated toxin RatA of RatAB toxin-antitoxin module